MPNIADIRKDYKLQTLLEKDVNANPFLQFGNWWQQAIDSQIDEVNAITLATVNSNLQPSARTVLLKDFNEIGFTFFTNYNSAKANQINNNSLAAICIFWKELERQIRIEGTIIKVDEAVSDAYFNSRPLGSKIGAWASPQSSVIDDRTVLEKNEIEVSNKFLYQPIYRPPHWGGYQLLPNYFEFWQGRSSRLHDRICYKKTNNLSWKIERLAP
jgi:pyridoxamine 5'-phosphate oxidase